MADRHDWEAVLLANLPPALVAFVSDLKLPPRYAIALDELGYDDVDDLANLDAAAMAKFRFDLEESRVLVLDTAQARGAEAEILQQHNIPEPVLINERDAALLR